MYTNFDDIAPLHDNEVSSAIQSLLKDEGFKHAIMYVMPNMVWEDFCNEMSQIRTKQEFQKQISCPIVWVLAQNCTTDIQTTNWENMIDGKEHLFLSNHRDIVLDAGLMNIMRNNRDIKTTEIAVGNNLLIYPWIEKLVRLNKSFIVKRGLPIKEQLVESRHLSEYIHYTIEEKKESIWIAQREGRAKDSDDRTQDSLLKMLTLHSEDKSFIGSLKKLNLVPMSISYEYDPCDYLKAKEFQQKRDNPNFKKDKTDDLKSMEIGILGKKGRIMFRFGECINKELDKIEALDKRKQIRSACEIIDKEIHKNYELFPVNYIAYDWLYKTDRFKKENKYTEAEKENFEKYIFEQIQKIDLENKDIEFLQHYLLVMYSNTLKNLLIATGVDKKEK